MTRRIEGEARAAVIRAQAQARRLGQPFIGCEHLLYGMSGSADAVGDALRARGVTPERVHAQIARMAAGSTPRRELDPGALEAIGVDLDAVRTRIEAAFGPGSLDDRTPLPRPGRFGKRAGRILLPSGHLSVTRQARRCLKRATRATESHPTDARDTAVITLRLLSANAGAMRAILSTLGTSRPQLIADVEGVLSRQRG